MHNLPCSSDVQKVVYLGILVAGKYLSSQKISGEMTALETNIVLITFCFNLQTEIWLKQKVYSPEGIATIVQTRVIQARSRYKVEVWSKLLSLNIRTLRKKLKFIFSLLKMSLLKVEGLV